MYIYIHMCKSIHTWYMHAWLSVCLPASLSLCALFACAYGCVSVCAPGSNPRNPKQWIVAAVQKHYSKMFWIWLENQINQSWESSNPQKSPFQRHPVQALFLFRLRWCRKDSAWPKTAKKLPKSSESAFGPSMPKAESRMNEILESKKNNCNIHSNSN